jgi:hypothetical protein
MHTVRFECKLSKLVFARHEADATHGALAAVAWKVQQKTMTVATEFVQIVDPDSDVCSCVSGLAQSQRTRLFWHRCAQLFVQ